MPFSPRLLALCLFVLALLAIAGSGAASAAISLEGCAPTARPVACGGAIAPTRPAVGLRALRAAKTFLGVPYSWGGESRGGLDCSGLVVVSFRAVGRTLPHYSGALWRLGRPVKGKVRRGDLVFFRLSGGVPGHVGIYAGRGRYIHSPSSGERVSYGLMRIAPTTSPAPAACVRAGTGEARRDARVPDGLRSIRACRLRLRRGRRVLVAGAGASAWPRRRVVALRLRRLLQPEGQETVSVVTTPAAARRAGRPADAGPVVAVGAAALRRAGHRVAAEVGLEAGDRRRGAVVRQLHVVELHAVAAHLEVGT